MKPYAVAKQKSAKEQLASLKLVKHECLPTVEVHIKTEPVSQPNVNDTVSTLSTV